MMFIGPTTPHEHGIRAAHMHGKVAAPQHEGDILELISRLETLIGRRAHQYANAEKHSPGIERLDYMDRANRYALYTAVTECLNYKKVQAHHLVVT